MLGETLTELLEQAERSTPEVRAAALLRIARVAAVSDRTEALRLFHAGLEASRGIEGYSGGMLVGISRMIAAAVAPEEVGSLPPGHDAIPFQADLLLRLMLDHGHVDAAVAYVLGSNDPSDFPFGMLSNLLLAPSLDDATRVAILRRAAAVWRQVGLNVRAPGGLSFVFAFEWHWNVLPAEEARAIASEIADRASRLTSEPMSARYDPEGTVHITNMGEHVLFQILHALRSLDPPLAESLIAQHPGLAAAARRFPKGTESIREETKARAEAANANRKQGGRGGYAMAGASGDFEYLHSLMDADRGGNFDGPLAHALEKYRHDAFSKEPNTAPKEFWPSTSAFRSTLYRAGKRLGRPAAHYLDRIPDADLRLFAAIELEAALAGLPEFYQVTSGRAG